jgi:uncharacterized membrane protein
MSQSAVMETTSLEATRFSENFNQISSQGGMYTPLPDGEQDGVVTAHAVQTIRADAEALYQLWRDVSLFPRWQEHVVSVTQTGDTTSHWVIGNPEDPKGKCVEFDSEITESVPGKRISWQSKSEDVDQSGTVTFEETHCGRGTLVTLVQRIKIGKLANATAAVAERSPKQTVKENLRHFKQLAETGEIPSVKGQPHGPRGVIGGIKEWMYGETNPTPPGTSEAAQS